MKKTMTIAATAATAGLSLLGAGTAGASDYKHPHTYEQATLGYAMTTHHLSLSGAQQYLQSQASQQKNLAELNRAGVGTDGAYFDAQNKLNVVVSDASQAAKVKAKGLSPKVGKGEKALADDTAKIQSSMRGEEWIASVKSDIASQKVQVTVTPKATSADIAKIKKAVPDAHIVTGAANQAQDDVLAGQDMNMPHNNGDHMMSTCSNGFMGKRANGQIVELTAGHCVENTAYAVNDAAGNHVGKILNSRFHTGGAGLDMGLIAIDSDDTAYGYVDTRGFDGYYGVAGMSKNAVGTQLCKSGRTTGWTCGTITGYNVSVNYGSGTTVSGLMSTTVCTQPGDSGGAYIGVGNMAQGMTSGGPTSQDCGGYNTGYNSSGISYVEPVVDAANYYGVTLLTGN